MGSEILLYLIGAPLVAGMLVLFLPDRLRGLSKGIGLAVATASLTGAVLVFLRKPVFWPTQGNASFRADPLAALAVLGIAFFAFVVCVYACGWVKKNAGCFFGHFLLALGAAFGAVLSNNLIYVLLFWGFLSIPFYLLVNFKGTPSAAKAAVKALMVIGGTDSLLILSVCLFGMASGSFSMDRAGVPLSGTLPWIAFLGFVIAAMAKAGAVPFHSWFPDVAAEAEPPVTAFLPASLDKLLAVYLLVRAATNLFVMTPASNTVLLTVGALTLIFASSLAIFQTDMNRLLAYCAVSQIGYMVLGIGSATIVGLAGGLFHMLNHALYKTSMFLGGGGVTKKTGTTDLARLGGLAKALPVTFVCFLVGSLAVSGVPPLNGFVSKWLVYQGLVESGKSGNALWVLWLAAAMFGSVLTAATFVKLMTCVFFGRPNAERGDVKEAGILFTAPTIVLSALCVIFGLFAFSFAIPVLVAPALPKGFENIGLWQPLLAAALLLTGVLAGALFYGFNRAKLWRTAAPFAGGDPVEELNPSTGVDFYETVRTESVFGAVDRAEKKGFFDVGFYGSSFVSFFTKGFERLHNGVLPTYLVWPLLGMMVLFGFLFIGGK